MKNLSVKIFIGILALVIISVVFNLIRSANLIEVPYAKSNIDSRTCINHDMIKYMKISKKQVNYQDNLIIDKNQILDKCIAYGVAVPKNSFFYKEQIVESTDFPDNLVRDIPDGYSIYSLSVDSKSAIGITPNSYVDLYFKSNDDSNKIIYDKFIEFVLVLAVLDSQGKDVFGLTGNSENPTTLLLTLPTDMYLLLKKAEYLTAEITPTPHPLDYGGPHETLISREYIRDFILSKSVTIPE